MIFLAIQQINFIVTYYINFGHIGNQRCCTSIGMRVYVTFLQTLFGGQAILYFGYFFSRDSLQNLQSKFRKKKSHVIIANCFAVILILGDLTFVTLKAYRDKMETVESFMGRLSPSPSTVLFYFNFFMNCIPMVFIAYFYKKIRRRGYEMAISQDKFFLSQKLMTEYADNYYLPRKVVLFLMVYLVMDRMDAVLTWITHYYLNDILSKNTNEKYIIDGFRWLSLYIFNIYPGYFVYRYIYKRRSEALNKRLMTKRSSVINPADANMAAASANLEDLENRTEGGTGLNGLDLSGRTDMKRLSSRIQKKKGSGFLGIFGNSSAKDPSECNNSNIPLINSDVEEESVDPDLEEMTLLNDADQSLSCAILALASKYQYCSSQGGCLAILKKDYFVKRAIDRMIDFDPLAENGEAGGGFLQHQFEYKILYDKPLNFKSLKAMLIGDWESVDLEQLKTITGIGISYFEGLNSGNLLNEQEMGDLISQLYGAIDKSEPNFGNSQYSRRGVKAGALEIQVITKHTKLFLLKRFMRNLSEHLRKNQLSLLKPIRTMFTYTPTGGQPSSFIVLGRAPEGFSEPNFSYSVSLFSALYSEWDTYENRMIPLKRRRHLPSKHGLNPPMIRRLIQVVSRDIEFLKQHHLKGYVIDLEYYKLTRGAAVLNNDDSYYASKGKYLCVVTIRRYLLRDILRVLAHVEGHDVTSADYGKTLLTNFQTFVRYNKGGQK